MMGWKDKTPLEANWCLTLQRKKINGFIYFISTYKNSLSTPPNSSSIFVYEYSY